jgi:hypothetical protein
VRKPRSNGVLLEICVGEKTENNLAKIDQDNQVILYTHTHTHIYIYNVYYIHILCIYEYIVKNNENQGRLHR